MQPLAPLDAIAPAISRARNLLLHDFRLGRFLKVALVAALAEGMGVSSFNINAPFRGPIGGGGHRTGIPQITPEQVHMLILVAIGAAMILIPLALVLMYLSARFTLVTFDMVLLQRPFVRPGWEALRRAGNRFFGLRILLALLGLCVLLACFVALFPGLRIAIHGGGWSHLLGTALAIAPFFLLYILAMLLFQCFVATAVVPRMALEDDSISDSIADGWRALRNNIGSFLVYFLLRGAISLAIVFVSIIALVISVVVLALLLGIIVFALYHFLWSGGLGAKAVVIAVGVLLGLALFLVYMAAIIAVAGFRNVFRQAYALLYYGGHYEPLGKILAPPAPEPTATPLSEPPVQPAW